MSEDLRKKKSEWLLKLALEEQLEQEEDMQKYSTKEQEEVPQFSEEHEKRMKQIFEKLKKTERRKKYKKYMKIGRGVIVVSYIIIQLVLFFCKIKKG